MRQAEQLGLMTRLSPEQQEASKQQILQQFGKNNDEIWLFGYGSLMWNPCINYIDRQPGTIYGYHRSFCLQTHVGRGSQDCPGLMLALKPGGSCRGIAYRIDPAEVETELDLIWKREMISGAYIPRILRLHTALGEKRTVVFVINTEYPNYRSALSLEESASMMAIAGGWLGTCAEYLFNTVAHLEQLGIRNSHLHQLMLRVKQKQAVQV